MMSPEDVIVEETSAGGGAPHWKKMSFPAGEMPLQVTSSFALDSSLTGFGAAELCDELAAAEDGATSARKVINPSAEIQPSRGVLMPLTGTAKGWLMATSVEGWTSPWYPAFVKDPLMQWALCTISHAPGGGGCTSSIVAYGIT
jgi:hypothetical protein